MCGITAIINPKDNIIDIKKQRINALRNSRAIRHRGPDGTGAYQINNHIFTHERLSIIDPKGGNQPLFGSTVATDSGKVVQVLCVNGEIFNFKELKDSCDYMRNYRYKTGSDCEVLLALWNMLGAGDAFINGSTESTQIQNTIAIQFFEKLNGQYSFVLYEFNEITGREIVFVGRDPFGITSLYHSYDQETGAYYIASELKALVNTPVAKNISIFENGCYVLKHSDPSIKNTGFKPFTTLPQTYNYTCYLPTCKWLYNYDINDDKTTTLEKPENATLSKYLPDSTLECITAEILSDTEQDESYIEQNISLKEPITETFELLNLYKTIRTAFIDAVKIRMVSDVPYGVLLSGGLDSSLVASIVSRYYHESSTGDDVPIIHKLNTFSIGLPDAPDLLKAREVAAHIKSQHHEFTFTLQEAWDALPEVIEALETYDITTIRASTPMYLMSRKIKALGIKMVLSGEGSDELLGGYLYFHAAPNNRAHRRECKRRLKDLAYFDCLRADKSTMSWGLEARVPFLDLNFVAKCIDIHKDIKCQKGIEKYVIRRAFDSKGLGEVINESDAFLPDSILWRQKEQFSDGVGYGWIDFLKDSTSKLVTDEDFANAAQLYPYNTPATKEAYYYRYLYTQIFGDIGVTTVKKWIPNQKWAGVSADPSGRAQSTHIAKINT